MRMLLIYNRCPSPCPSCQIRTLRRGPNSESDVKMKLVVHHFPMEGVCIMKIKNKEKLHVVTDEFEILFSLYQVIINVSP